MNKPYFNRRFVRIQAVQRLHAFYVNKQASYACMLDQLRHDLVPHVLAAAPPSEAQLAEETRQAQALFKASLASVSSAPLSTLAHASRRVQAAVRRALVSYENSVAQDTHRLEQGLAEAVVSINQACVRSWQLLVEWSHIAKKRAARPRLGPKPPTVGPGCLADNCLLQRLQNAEDLPQLVQQQAAGWDDHELLVQGWYHQFVKKEPTLQPWPAQPPIAAQAQQQVAVLLEKILFGQSAIQTVFSEQDLHWDVHRRIVKRLVHQSLVLHETSSAKGFKLSLLIKADWALAQFFYTDLVRKTLQHDVALEALIAQKASNWGGDRLVLLDKTIVKLALCEMLHCPNVPVKVSINEYIDVAKTYSTPKSSSFVNGVLDAVAVTLHQAGTDKA